MISESDLCSFTSAFFGGLMAISDSYYGKPFKTPTAAEIDLYWGRYPPICWYIYTEKKLPICNEILVKLVNYCRTTALFGEPALFGEHTIFCNCLWQVNRIFRPAIYCYHHGQILSISIIFITIKERKNEGSCTAPVNQKRPSLICRLPWHGGLLPDWAAFDFSPFFLSQLVKLTPAQPQFLNLSKGEGAD